MAIDIVVLVVILGVLVYLPFMFLRTAKSGDQKTLKHPDRKHWLVLAICAGEIVGFGLVLEFVMTFFVPQNQLNQLPLPVQGLGFIMVVVGAVSAFWAGIKYEL